ncbi:MAG: hypothetical protein DRR16_16530 [Candidatus Parabeggiatoa sp. nov. 3]|nr:MAG: hypothetical protein DRR00_21290 [Gammaproteobacteria bacterium]RKZ62941.1 MAG: hypothetical protein DRQ99_17910 [Gammaproteobacteria bacterium]RKZ83749.1 MAG: hypothetical protein DRR16_16530 [Gammaproteobacteria bacterium]HEW98796.1 hypothetical protein [Beggiatoa sp.]
MNPEIYKEMEDFYIISSCIGSNKCIYILFENHYDDFDEDAKPMCRIGFFYPETEEQWGYVGFGNFCHPMTCVLPAPYHTFIAVDEKGQVVTRTGVTSDVDFNIEERIPLIHRTYVNRVREIDGAAFIVGTVGTVFRREGPNNWTCLYGNDVDSLNDEQKNRFLSFYDIGGFDLNDIYACGNNGHLYHYNGEQWRTIDCPTNEDMKALCCAPNGKVYIGGRNGMVIEGREDEWQIIDRPDPYGLIPEDGMLSTNVIDMTWYKDRLYIAAEQGVYEYTEGRIKRSPSINIFYPEEVKLGEPLLNDRIKKFLVQAGADESTVDLWGSLPELPQHGGILCPSHLRCFSTDGELLLLAGDEQVVVYNGDTWQRLY